MGQAETSSYRSIFKATSLFGGVQVYQILIGIIKSKFVAVLLGPAGMGIQGLYQSTLDLIKSFSAFGLEQSAVRDISESHGSNDIIKISSTVATVRRLVWLTGTLGLVVTLFLSPLLSRLTFGDSNYIWGFAILSITLLINQICAGQKVLLQGMRKLKDLAKASAIGSTIGLLVSIPLYYLFGIKGIVPSMIVLSIAAMIIFWYYSSRIKVENISITTKEALVRGKSMIKMGIAMSVSNILVTSFAYILRWYIRQQGGLEDVGLFTAGLLLSNTYVGMVFNAMGTDYYPRLSAVNKDNNQCRIVINQQAEIAVLIMAPLIVSCILFMPIIIRLIYSPDFMPANNYIMFAVTGMLFKAASFCISYVFLAKAESKLFIINEAVSNLYVLLLNILGYKLYSLTGLGVSYILGYILYLSQVYLIVKHRYNFHFSSSFIRIYAILLLFVATCVLLVFFLESNWKYVPSSIIFICCLIFSLKELNKRIQLSQFITNKLIKQ